MKDQVNVAQLLGARRSPHFDAQRSRGAALSLSWGVRPTITTPNLEVRS